MPAYATVAEFEAYVEGWVTDDALALARYLERASRDVDGLLNSYYGPLTTGAYTGLKLDPTRLRSWEAAALSRATCAQAEYLIETGDVAFVTAPLAGRIKGPDFEVETTAPSGVATVSTYGPKLRRELAPIRHLRQTGARALP
jgi:hypothetical protein